MDLGGINNKLKKLLGILVLGLLWCNVGFAYDDAEKIYTKAKYHIIPHTGYDKQEVAARCGQKKKFYYYFKQVNYPAGYNGSGTYAIICSRNYLEYDPIMGGPADSRVIHTNYNERQKNLWDQQDPPEEKPKKKEPSQTQKSAEYLSSCKDNINSTAGTHFEIYKFSSLNEYKQKNPMDCHVLISKKETPELFDKIISSIRKEYANSSSFLFKKSDYFNLLEKFNINFGLKNIKIRNNNQNIQIAKKEPNQTQNDEWIAIFTHPKSKNDFISINNTKSEVLKRAELDCFKFVTLKTKKEANSIVKDYKSCKLKLVKHSTNNKFYISLLWQGENISTIKRKYNLTVEKIDEIKKTKYELEQKNINKYLQADLKNEDLTKFNLEKETIELVKVKRQERREILYAKTCTGVIFGHKKGTFEWHKCLEEKEQKELFKGTEIKIVKKDKDKPLKPEKIIKTTSADNEAPILQVVEVLTVHDPRYIIEGRVSDKGSDKIYLKVDGQDIPVTKGKFKIKRYSPVDENIKITAIDKWGNEVTKIIKVTVDLESKDVAEKIEPLNPSKIRTKSSNTKVALIIGIENYIETPKATYANLDAKYFFDYARRAFGVKKQNINLLIDDKATLGSINKVLFKWLVSKVKANQTDLIIFFAGHGLASNDGKELYFLPQDADPDLLSIMALSRTKLFQTIVDLKPKSVTMFLDTCYSGVSRDEQMLLASARPIRIVAGDEGEIPNNFTIFSATQLDQISSGFKEAKHGIFSYYLMKGLEGKADKNKDRKITNGELLAYMDINVSQKALEQGRQQNPSLSGDPNQVLMKY